MVVFSNISVPFANITDPGIDPKVNYNFSCTTTDKIMNKVCGAILILYMLVGTVVCIHLIHFYRKHRNSWLDRFLYFTSIARLPYIITNSLYVAYQLLNKKPPTQILELEAWGTVLNILSYIISYVVMALDIAMVATQYCNIHHPEWTLLNSQSVVLKRVLVGTAALFIACYSPAIAYNQVERRYETFDLYPFPEKVVYGTAISLAPFFLMASLILGIYLTTWIKYWQETGDMRVGRIVRSEFKLVSLITLSDVICSVSYAAFLINQFLITQDSIRINLYMWSISGAIFPMTIGMVVIFYMFFIGTKPKFGLIRRWCCCEERQGVLN